MDATQVTVKATHLQSLIQSHYIGCPADLSISYVQQYHLPKKTAMDTSHNKMKYGTKGSHVLARVLGLTVPIVESQVQVQVS
jgi:hypothetical protein